MNFECLIPAAGFSSRMGSWKLMLPYKGSTIIGQAVDNALSFCGKVILVTGYRGGELEKLYDRHPGVITVRNTGFKRGMFSSIQTGVPLISTEWFFITMGDMPDITEKLYRKLAEAADGEKDTEIVRPLFSGKRGHPVLLKNTVIPTILSEPWSSEMKNVFTHHKVLNLDMNLPETFTDIDTIENYRSAVKNFS